MVQLEIVGKVAQPQRSARLFEPFQNGAQAQLFFSIRQTFLQSSF